MMDVSIKITKMDSPTVFKIVTFETLVPLTKSACVSPYNSVAL